MLNLSPIEKDLILRHRAKCLQPPRIYFAGYPVKVSWVGNPNMLLPALGYRLGFISLADLVEDENAFFGWRSDPRRALSDAQVIADLRLLFHDEPKVTLDPVVRHLAKALRAAGKTTDGFLMSEIQLVSRVELLESYVPDSIFPEHRP